MQPPACDITDEAILSLMLDERERNTEQGLRLMMEKYQERLYWLVRRMVGDHEDANDVLQNCFIKAYRGIGSFERKAKLYTWLYKIASNEALTFLSKRKNSRQTSLDERSNPAVLGLAADSYFDSDAAQLALQKAVDTLPGKQKLVFNMRYYEEMPYEEISQVVGTSVGALKASFHHAVKKIERYIQQVEIS